MAEVKNKKQNKKKQPCRFFAAGKCRYGDKCRYEHLKADAPEPKVSEHDVSNYVKNVSSPVADLTTRRVVIPLAASAAIHFAEQEGIPYWTRASRKSNHAVAAASRTEAVRKAVLDGLRKLGSPLSADILDYFGAGRNAGIFSAETNVTFHNYGPYLVAGDAARGFVRIDDPPPCDFGLIQDVYHGADSTLQDQQPVDASTVRRLLDRCEFVYVITRQFHGEAGAEVYFDAEKRRFPEAAWVKRNGLVYFSPHRGAQRYSPHPIPILGVDRTLDGLDVAEIAIVGPYAVYLVRPTPPGARPLAPASSDPGRFIRRRLNVKNSLFRTFLRNIGLGGLVDKSIAASVAWSSLWGQIHSETEVIVDMEAVAGVQATASTRPSSGLNMDSVAVNLKAFWRADPVMQELAYRFPQDAEKIQRDTDLWVRFGNKGERADEELRLRDLSSDADSKLARARAKEWCPEPRSWWPVVGIAAAAATALFLLGKFTVAGDISASKESAYQIIQAGFDSLSPFISRCVEGISSFFAPLIQNMSGKMSSAVGETVQVLHDNRRTLVLAGSLFYTCVATPVIEECLKQYTPWWLSLPLFGWEFFDIAARVGQEPALAVATMHCITYGLGQKSLALATGLHMAWNFSAVLRHGPTGRPPVQAGSFGLVCAGLSIAACLWWQWRKHRRPSVPTFEEWRDEYYHKQEFYEEEVSAVVPIAPGSTLSSVDSKILGVHKDGLRGSIEVTLNGMSWEPCAACAVTYDATPCERSRMWPILATSGMLWLPAPSSHNLLVSLYSRQHRNKPQNLAPEEEIQANWLQAIESCCRVNEVVPLEAEDFPADLADALHTQSGARRAEILKSREEHHQGRIKPSLKFFQKTDETLCPDWREFLDADGNVHVAYTIKPRIIANLPLYVHAATAELARAITARCKKTFDGTPRAFEVKIGSVTMPVTLRIFWCAGVTAAKGADLAFRSMLDGFLTFAACGDDNMLGWGPLAIPLRRLPYEEGDFSMMDSTLDKPISVDGLRVWATNFFDADPRIVDFFVQGMQVSYSAKKSDLYVRGEAGVQFSTGSTLTSTHQTLVTIYFFFHLLHNLDVDSPEAARRIGMKLTNKCFSDPFDVNFLHLRGLRATVDGEETHVMAPLPGQIVKLGKVCTDPITITKMRGHPPLDPERALLGVAHAISISQTSIPPNFPVLGPFLTKLAELGCPVAKSVAPGAVIQNYAFKQRVTTFTLNDSQRREALLRAAQRYDTTVDEILEVEDLIRSVTVLPSLLFHPLFSRMAVVDYG